MDLTIYKIYEIQNKGKGVITSLTPANLLSLLADPEIPSLEEVLIENPNLADRYITRMNATAGWEIRGQEAGSGYIYVDGNEAEDTYPLSAIGTRDDSGDNEAEIRNALEFYQEDILLRDLAASRGIVNAGDYEANFVARSLITKQYADTKFGKKQKVLTYPTDFTLGNYIFTDNDDEYLIFINNAGNAVTLTVPTGLLEAFFVAVIQQGTGVVSFVASGTTINPSVGLKIEDQNFAVALDKVGTTEVFHLTGNNKL